MVLNSINIYISFFKLFSCLFTAKEQTPVIQEPEADSNPDTCPITPGKECTIEIQKGKSGLGLSIVGGSDTLLVSCFLKSLHC